MAGTMTAAMVAGVVAPVAASASENAFPDVQSGQWYTKAINEMAAKNHLRYGGRYIWFRSRCNSCSSSYFHGKSERH